MKNKSFYNLLKLSFGIALFGIVSCQSEPIDEVNEQLESDTLSSKKKNKKGNTATFDMSQSCYVTSKTDLYAGQNILVGDVTVSETGGVYIITYNITNNGYCLTSTHLSVVEYPEDFPMGGGGNPKNGHFEYSGSHDCVSTYSYEVPTSKGSFIAAHAVVNCVSETEVSSENIESLPINTEVCVTDKGDENSYFDIAVGGDSFLSGNHNAWCIDLYKSLDNGQCFNANLVSLLDDSVNNAVHKPENLAAVNWIINQDFVSQGYTFGEVQWAIWELLEDDNTPNFYCCLGEWEMTNGEAIVTMAMENSNFVPGCGDFYGIAIIPTDTSVQPIVITTPVECDTTDCEETAWGDGCDFPGNNWATYFHYSPE